MSIGKLEKQLSDLQEFITSLQLSGINSNLTRINKYLKYQKTYIEAVKNGTSKQLQESDEYRDFTNSFYEITQLVDIYSGLKNIELKTELKERIKKYITGPDFIGDENALKANNNPRDIGFELLIGSRLLQAGYNVLFNTDGDLEYKTGNQNIYIECKRPSSEKRLKENTDKAFKQLEKRYETDTNGKGIIAISIGKLINKEHNILSVENRKALKYQVQQIIGQFMQTNLQSWINRPDKRTIGVFVFLEIPSHVEEENNFQISTYMGIFGICPQESNDFKFLAELYEKLSKFLDPEIVNHPPSR